MLLRTESWIKRLGTRNFSFYICTYTCASLWLTATYIRMPQCHYSLLGKETLVTIVNSFAIKRELRSMKSEQRERGRLKSILKEFWIKIGISRATFPSEFRFRRKTLKTQQRLFDRQSSRERTKQLLHNPTLFSNAFWQQLVLDSFQAAASCRKPAGSSLT
jgi:hypothetical protein